MLDERQFRELFPTLRAQDRALYYHPMIAACAEHDIHTPPRLAAFCAQLAHESVGLGVWREIWGPTPAQARYEGRTDLGNVQPGDGYRYRGRGPIQITGRRNYRAAGQALNVPLEDDPDQALRPEVGFRVAAWYWRTRQLNTLADRDDMTAYRLITRAINGGLTGWEDRLRRWVRARAILGLAPLPVIPQGATA